MKLKLLSILGFLISFPITTIASTTFTVDSPDDTIDINPGDCICSDGNYCSLRAAIMEANACSGADTIELPANTYVLTLTGSDEDEGYTGDLDVTEDLTINGEGSSTTIVDANGIDRVFHIFDGVVNFNGFTIENGNPPCRVSTFFCYSGGGALVEFSDSSSAFSLDEIHFSNNFANIDGGALYISETGSLSISDSSFENNESDNLGGVYISSVNTEIENSTFTANIASGSGGALYVSSSVVEIDGSAFTGNISNNKGSAVYVTDSGSELTVYQSTFSENDSAYSGIIYNEGQSVWILSSTISDNHSSSCGGGLVNERGTTWVFNSTISGNTASCGGGIYSDEGIFYISHSTITNNTGYYGGGGLYGDSFYLKNTILIGNSFYYGGGVGSSSDDCDDTTIIVSEDYNWFDSAECSSMTASSNDVDEPYDSSYLDSLADNGGPTETHAITRDSPAHNEGTCYDLDDDRVSFDQRGRLRIRKCDIGAYEIGPAMKIPTFPLGGGMIIH